MDLAKTLLVFIFFTSVCCFRCRVCDGPRHECFGGDVGRSANCSSEWADFFEACVQQTIRITDPDETRVFRYCFSPEDSDSFQHSDDDTSDYARVGSSSSSVGGHGVYPGGPGHSLDGSGRADIERGCDLNVWHVDGVDYVDQKCICSQEDCNLDCKECDQYKSCV